MKQPKQFNPDRDVAPWKGAYRRYDLLKEGAVALAGVLLLTLILAAVFSSPDERALTLQQWSKADPMDFTLTAAAELAGSSATATYGAPYTHVAGSGAKLGPLNLQSLMGVAQPIDAPKAFVLDPLASVPNDPALSSALQRYQAAASSQQQVWNDTYAKALAKATLVKGNVVVKPGNFGPVATLVAATRSMAQTGALDQAVITEKGFYSTDYTKPSLFLADGAWFMNHGVAQHLGGDQWGMMNETGNYPGQAWLWLYTFWYQIKPFSTSENADVQVWALMLLLTAVLALLPFIPGLRSIPRWSRVYRLIWRDHYRSTR
jgi:hypothetical protein